MSKRKEVISRSSVIKKREVVKGLYILAIIASLMMIGVGHWHPRNYELYSDVDIGKSYFNVTFYVHPDSVIKIETTDNLAGQLPADHIKLIDTYIEENVTDITIYTFIVKGLSSGVKFHVEWAYVVDYLGVVSIVHSIELRRTRGIVTIITSTMIMMYRYEVNVKPLKRRKKIRRRKVF